MMDDSTVQKKTKKKLVVLSGAGISAESGLRTFRDSDGLWEGYEVTEVATPGAWRRNPALVLDFYNQRRRDIAAASPNAAHLGLAELENLFQVQIITQNIDDLHERAGSTQVLHLHGEIFTMKSDRNDNILAPVREDMLLGSEAPDGGLWRPAIVWFEEPVPLIGTAAAMVSQADYFAVIGTSLAVYPAAGLLHHAAPAATVFIVDKRIPEISGNRKIIRIEKPATEGVALLAATLAAKLTQ